MKAHLAKELSQGQIHVLDPCKYKLKQLQEMAHERNYDMKRNETLKKERWVGKEKGLLQVLWERGWIDKTNLQEYQEVIQKYDEGKAIDDFSLEVLMASCLLVVVSLLARCWLSKSYHSVLGVLRAS